MPPSQVPLHPAPHPRPRPSSPSQKTGQSIWSEHRKSRPLSFRSAAAAMLRWDRLSLSLPESKLIELARDIPPPASRGPQ
mmetsp:Transcript_30618/g.61494  ORF Transcript_30618/g.61494 Transcript_30618/m.61494 type:complete len:80 (+) Transcript_30618:218-457(+)